VAATAASVAGTGATRIVRRTARANTATIATRGRIATAAASMARVGRVSAPSITALIRPTGGRRRITAATVTSTTTTRRGQRQYGAQGDRDRGYGRQPQGYQYEDRGFFERAGDEVRSWFGDDDAERRREQDSRYDERQDRVRQSHRDEDYHSWRSGQIAALDRDYDEYRRENRSKFDSEFGAWRTSRQGQRDQLTKVAEHQEVVGSDGAHVGTVDKVKGDRILLTKNDQDAGGRHHSIPSSWITAVDDKVTLSKTADEAKRAWQDEDRNSAMFGFGDNAKRGRDDDDGRTGGNLNRSFSGTY